MPKIRIYNFRKFANKVLSHTKELTMRLPRKRESQAGDLMHPYIVFFPGEATIKKLVRKRLKDITLEDAQLDGFNSINECQLALMKMHNCKLSQPIDLTYFDPHWQPLQIINLYDYQFILKRIDKIIGEMHEGWKHRYDLKIVYDMLVALIKKEDPRIDMRSLDVYLIDGIED